MNPQRSNMPEPGGLPARPAPTAQDPNMRQSNMRLHQYFATSQATSAELAEAAGNINRLLGQRPTTPSNHRDTAAERRRSGTPAALSHRFPASPRRAWIGQDGDGMGGRGECGVPVPPAKRTPYEIPDAHPVSNLCEVPVDSVDEPAQ